MDSPISLKKQWGLTKESLGVFLAKLDPDEDRAGQKYEVIRLRLVKYFQWGRLVEAEEAADETINRVARKIEQGEDVYNLNAYLYGVAKLVSAERMKKQNRNQQISEEENEIQAAVPEEEDEEAAERRACFEKCLADLPEQNRVIIIEYYRYEKQDKIKHRKELAATQGVTVNALRINAHRTRMTLEACVRECLGRCA